MKNYYEILGIPDGADEEVIKKAFRSLVKQYHPDLNPNTEARARFLEVHEAYECLSDPARREAFDRRNGRRKISPEELERRERVYREWLWNQQELAKKRAEAYAGQSFEEYEESKWFRVAKGVNKVYNVLFLAFCLAIIVIPVYRFILERSLPEDQQRSIVFFAAPVIAGLIFASWGYYYWFILKHDEI